MGEPTWVYAYLAFVPPNFSNANKNALAQRVAKRFNTDVAEQMVMFDHTGSMYSYDGNLPADFVGIELAADQAVVDELEPFLSGISSNLAKVAKVDRLTGGTILWSNFTPTLTKYPDLHTMGQEFGLTNTTLNEV